MSAKITRKQVIESWTRHGNLRAVSIELGVSVSRVNRIVIDYCAKAHNKIAAQMAKEAKTAASFWNATTEER